MPDDLLPALPPSLGMVIEAGRGSLPYSLIHGEPLVRCAAMALEESGIEPIDADTPWPAVLEMLEDYEVLVWHDALCPLTPPRFLARCASLAAGGDAAVIGHRPVSDTVKVRQQDRVGETIDRDGLAEFASPVALPVALVHALPRAPGHDLAGLVSTLAGRGVLLAWEEAPPEGRPVVTSDDVRLLEALTR